MAVMPGVPPDRAVVTTHKLAIQSRTRGPVRENFRSEALQMLARCIEKPITTASIMDKERIMSGCPGYRRILVMEGVRRQKLELVI
jgi:hypothetical protein